MALLSLLILLMGMTLIPKHVMTACQYKGDKDDTVLAVSFIRKSFSSKARGSAPVIKVSGCTHSEGEYTIINALCSWFLYCKACLETQKVYTGSIKLVKHYLICYEDFNTWNKMLIQSLLGCIFMMDMTRLKCRTEW